MNNYDDRGGHRTPFIPITVNDIRDHRRQRAGNVEPPSSAVRGAILTVHRNFPDWDEYRIEAYLRRNGHPDISVDQIGAVLASVR